MLHTEPVGLSRSGMSVVQDLSARSGWGRPWPVLEVRPTLEAASIGAGAGTQRSVEG